MSNDVVIVSTARTPLAKSWRGGLNMTHGATLAGHAIQHAVERSKVDPNEIEDVLSGHPNVIEAAVVGKPDDKTGEAVCAHVALSEEVPVEDIIAFCREELTGYKVPKHVTVHAELPKSTVGKILRRELRDQ